MVHRELNNYVVKNKKKGNKSLVFREKYSPLRDKYK